MSYLTEGLKHQFAYNIELVAQEEGKLRKYVTEEEQETELAEFSTMEGQDGDHPSRLVPPKIKRQSNCQDWIVYLLLNRNYKTYLLADPTSQYPQMVGAAMSRAMDREIIRAVASPVSRPTRSRSINFNIANNVVPLGLLNSAGDAVGLKNDKRRLCLSN